MASENQLSGQFKVSRMTARRALEDLSEAGFLFRSQGLGTFVSDSRPMSSMLEIRNIADEISERGNVCKVSVLTLEQIIANQQQANHLGVNQGSEIFHSRLVFFENDQAIQYEDRLVNPLLAPEYLNQDFSQTTPNHYLSKVAPLTEADHSVEAVLAGQLNYPRLLQQMKVESTAPCLYVIRRTFSAAGIVSIASLIHPGDRYRLGGHIQIKP